MDYNGFKIFLKYTGGALEGDFVKGRRYGVLALFLKHQIINHHSVTFTFTWLPFDRKMDSLGKKRKKSID